jgi:hypothetical protein
MRIQLTKITLAVSIMLAMVFTPATFAQNAYTISGSGTSFYANKDEDGSQVGSVGAIQTVIDAIKADANGEPCEIQFGNGTTEINIGTASIEFSGSAPGWDVILSGKITSSTGYPGSIVLTSGANVESKADIKGNGVSAISNSGGTLTISGGTISATGELLGVIYSTSYVTLNINSIININGGTISATATGSTYSVHAVVSSGSVVLSGSPNITGDIFNSGNISVLANFAPGEKVYTLDFTYAANAVAVENGKDFIANFELANNSWKLITNGNDLVLADANTPVLANASTSNIHAYALGNSIVLQNLPQNAKVEVFGLNGKRIYSAHPENHLIGGIGVQTIDVHAKGIYIVKVSSGSEKKTLRVAVR